MSSFWGSITRGDDAERDDSYEGGSDDSSNSSREQGQHQSSTGDSGKIDDGVLDRGSDASPVLSPKGPPPTRNVFQHTLRLNQFPSPTSPAKSKVSAPSIANLPPPMSPKLEVSLADLTRRRPLDPVFKASEGTFPKMTEDALSMQPPVVHIFDPSQKEKTEASESNESSHKASEGTFPKMTGDALSMQPPVVHIFDPSQKEKTEASESNESSHNQDVSAALHVDGSDQHQSVSANDEESASSATEGSSDGPDDESSETNASVHEVGIDDSAYEWANPGNLSDAAEDSVEGVVSLQDYDETTEPEEQDVRSEGSGHGLVEASNSIWPKESGSGSDQSEEPDNDVNEDVVGTTHAAEPDSEWDFQVLQHKRENSKVETDDEDCQAAPVEDEPESAAKSSKFIFLSDQKDVPFGLKMLQERTMRRRRELLARMHDLDCQLARVSSSFAEEKMDLDLAVRDTFDRCVSQLLEAAAERLVMEREASTARGRGVAALEHRLTKLDHQMTHQAYVTLSDHKRDQLDGLHSDLFHDIVPGINIENSKSNKIELGVVRRFEDTSGKVTKDFHEECAARHALMAQAQKKVDTVTKTEDQRLDHILVAISELRAKTRQERAERREADARILEQIVSATVTMKRALLDAVGNTN